MRRFFEWLRRRELERIAAEREAFREKAEIVAPYIAATIAAVAAFAETLDQLRRKP